MFNKSKNMITREESVVLLEELTEIPFDNDVMGKLTDILYCIEGEMEGRHEWGAERSNVYMFHVGQREWTKEEIEEGKKADEMLRFVPSEHEKYDLIKKRMNKVCDVTGQKPDMKDVKQQLKIED